MSVSTKWSELTKKKPPELSDAERVAIAAVMDRSVNTHSHSTMAEIYDELLGIYNHLFSHCDPLPRDSGASAGPCAAGEPQQ